MPVSAGRTTARAVLVAAALAAGLLSAPGAALAEPVVLVSTDFEDGTYAPWTPSGAPGLSVVDADGGKALLVSDRVNDYDGIQSPTGLLQPGGQYTFSGRARLAAGTPGSAEVRFVVKPDYTWVGNTTVTADAWTTLEGTFTAPAGADPSALQIYVGTSDTGAPYSYLLDDLVVTGTAPPTGGEEVLRSDFEDGLQGWVPRDDGSGPPTVSVTAAEARTGAQSALVSGRTSQGDGIGRDVTGVLAPGTTYQISAWVKFAAGAPTGDVWLSLQRRSGGADSFDTLAQVAGVTSGEWREVTATYQLPASDFAFLYVETDYPSGSSADLLVDDVVITSQAPPAVEDLTPLQDTVPFPVGVAIDSRETTGGPAELLNRHFGQITPENHFKPSYWYGADRTFGIGTEAATLMDFSRANDLRVYGHTLVWHQQNPDWFFTDASGAPLGTDDASKQLLRERLRTHVFSVAEALSTGSGYGRFGSAENPVVSFDVVNEVISDGSQEADGMRRSDWYRVLGEEYVDLAFRYADEAFNQTYAEPGSVRPVTLFINDYNTEQTDKRLRLRALVERLLARGVPVDGVGHQFHVTLSTPVSTLDEALVGFEDLPVVQAVTELDVPTGTPVTERNLVEQGYYLRDAFEVFRAHADDLFSVTLWGLTDGRSWRSSAGAPLMFDDRLKAKPAYYGAAGADLPPLQQAAFSFANDVPLDAAATTAPLWDRLPLQRIGDVGRFSTRWSPDHLSVLVRVSDPAADAGDSVTVTVGDASVTVPRAGGPGGVVTEVTGGWSAVAHVPLDGAAAGQALAADVSVVTGSATTTWGGDAGPGQLTLVEPLTFAEVENAFAAPVVDGAVEDAWTVDTGFGLDRLVSGTSGATATVRTLWRDDTLYLLAQVADPVIDVSAGDPYQQDSLELFVDTGNAKNGAYRREDNQIRISADNVLSFGTGDSAFQAGRITSATARVDGGYVVEVAIDLLDAGIEGSFHGLDVQLNDASGGVRTSVRTWADPTGTGYQTTSRWGVVQLVVAPDPVDPAVTTSKRRLRTGQPVEVTVSGFAPGARVDLVLKPRRGDSGPDRSLRLGRVVTGADGSAVVQVMVPREARPGAATLVARSGGTQPATQATTWVTVVRGNGGAAPR